jgi:3-deoxy-D-manno-octulosonic-acid transferase
LYTFLLYLAMPFIFLRLFWRSRRMRDYRLRLGERLGFYPAGLDKCLWVHAVSVGEVIAAIPLIQFLQAQYPELPMLVTTMTPTGAARVKAAFGDTVKHAYLPYDLPGALGRFFAAMHPVACVIIETEMWPNMLAACQQRNVPVCLTNARLSEKSAQGYARIASLTRGMLKNVNHISVVGQADADRFLKLGAQPGQMVVTGNLKFDLLLPAELPEQSASLRAALGRHRFIWIAASTHEGEEDIILQAHRLLLNVNPVALLILVPRHPDRFNDIAVLSAKQFNTQRRSANETIHGDTTVYLGDTMGEMLLMYGAADAALVGGSLIPRGGHNILEPAVLAKPILTGMHVFNFTEICNMFYQADALIKVTDAENLAAQLIFLMQHVEERAALGLRARGVMDANRGALTRQLNIIQQMMMHAAKS